MGYLLDSPGGAKEGFNIFAYIYIVPFFFVFLPLALQIKRDKIVIWIKRPSFVDHGREYL